MTHEPHEIDMVISGLKEEFQVSSVEEMILALEIELKTISYRSPLLCGQHACYYQNQDKETIYISDACPDELRAFALAHELGHAILHDVEMAHLAMLNKPGTIEKEANYFATKLLDVRFDPYELDGFTADEIARIYGLREDAVEYIINS